MSSFSQVERLERINPKKNPYYRPITFYHPLMLNLPRLGDQNNPRPYKQEKAGKLKKMVQKKHPHPSPTPHHNTSRDVYEYPFHKVNGVLEIKGKKHEYMVVFYSFKQKKDP